jgi:hypothetical protein
MLQFRGSEARGLIHEQSRGSRRFDSDDDEEIDYDCGDGLGNGTWVRSFVKIKLQEGQKK